MRGSFGTKTITGLLLAFGLALGACGGGAQEQREPDWRPRERVPTVAEHWWHEPVERACEEGALPVSRRRSASATGSRLRAARKHADPMPH